MVMKRRLTRLFRRLSIPILGLFTLIAVGTVLFSYFEGYSLFNSFYWTITVISTVGFGDITPHTFYGKMLFIILVVFGLSLFGYFITVVTSFMTEEKIIRGLFAHFIADGGRLKDHIILLGWNSYMKYAYDEIIANRYKPLVVVEDEDLAKSLSRNGVNALVGSLTDLKLYSKINIKEAKAVIIASENHTQTILYTLKIRKVNREIPIIAAYTEKELDDVLKQAGITKLINIPDIGGRLLANEVFEPDAAEAAIDLVSRGNLDLSEKRISSNLDGISISEVKKAGLKTKIILVKRKSTDIPNPQDDFILSEGDILILLGLSHEIDKDKLLLDKYKMKQ